MRLTHLRIKNFRAIREAEIELPPFAVLIGPNGAGKTSFLDILCSAKEIIAGSYPQPFARCGSFQTNINYLSSGETIALGITIQNGEFSLDYDLELAAEGNGYFIQKEKLKSTLSHEESIAFERHDAKAQCERTYQGKLLPERGVIGHGPKTCLEDGAFSHLLRVPRVKVEEIFGALSSWEPYRFQPNERIRQPQQLQSTQMPSNDGSDLFSVLYNLQVEKRDVFEELFDLLRIAIPTFQSFDFPTFGGGGTSICVGDNLT